ncbi:MAG: hypothetical protein WCD18_21650 [Thermosynechococcaceae cyanobacterium]
MSHHPINRRFPVWQFLNQPVFHPDVKLILSPKTFWDHYRIDFLERCLDLTMQGSNKYPYA